MDKIQRELVKVGRKDLAEEYFNKIIRKTAAKISFNDRDAKEIAQITGREIFKRFKSKIEKKYPKVNSREMDEATFNAYTETVGSMKKVLKDYLDEIDWSLKNNLEKKN